MLPNTYWQLEYIEGTGTQYINTGLTPSYNLKALVRGRFTTNTGSQYAIGCYQATAINRFDVGLYNSILQLNIGSYKEINNVDVLQTHTYILDAPNNCTYIDEIQYTGYSTETGGNARNVLLFARWQSSITYYANFQAEIYQFWENDVLVRNYIPAMRKSDNVVGLYDDVNDVFYTNSGSGTFIAGPLVDAPLNITFTDNPLSFVVYDNISFIANFKASYQITLIYNSALGTASYTWGSGTEIVLTAIPNRYAEFDGWYINDVLLSHDLTTTYNVSSDVEIEARFSLLFNWIEPIVDRTETDIRTKTQKAYINYFDLNRIEYDTAYLCYRLHEDYPDLDNIVLKTNWTRTDIPTVGNMERIRSNAQTIARIYSPTYTISSFGNQFNYENANEIENALLYVKDIIDE